ncbi:hypothetical protein AUJ66_00755 [Candidatus Desantisbacteria bacterium CG1_02_38_46]|uniref:MurNAc-LAA domain-containing protein n=3 Tax=unclassified Candidatus Desantisiibacteriota TaxID=3106372 RepID=A0A2H9P9C7_9BACT|nr:MAG: hypothetical protein AUJ66_00755 [Candidatus Desantisbacteria bacterium CG1_02_38_46]PIU51722.1 MAG: hypothetical protein COS91_02930 [Candidatus Desantisbacteria bacterium CG07_land_8_20_14_0_80_39_15]PIZ14865.1 MAG: hypothetical protein COY51_07100 [Candidatus Desantisbacteria bacterium CG_4_10_14_0_8_um_filter_39_17]
MYKERNKKILGMFIILTLTVGMIFIPGKCYSKKPAPDVFVVIDPGHGGSNFGAWDYTGTKTYEHNEKYYNLQGSIRLREALQMQGVKVKMTRESEEYLSISDRIIKAKKWIKESLAKSKAKSTFFLSYHHNAFDKKTTGTLAKIRPGQETMSKDFANKAIDRVAMVGFKRDNLQITTERSAVLNWEGGILCPSIIEEICFIDVESDCLKLLSPGTGEAIANALTQAIMETAKEHLGVVISNVSPKSTVYSPSGRPEISATVTGLYKSVIKSSIEMYFKKKAESGLGSRLFLNYDPDNLEETRSFRVWYNPPSRLEYYTTYVVHVQAQDIEGKIGYLNWEFTLEPGKPVIFKTYPHGEFPRFVDKPNRTDWYAVPYRFNIGIPSDCPKEKINVEMYIGGEKLILSTLVYRGETTTVPGYNGVWVPLYTASFNGPTTWYMDEKQYYVKTYAEDTKNNKYAIKEWADLSVKACWLRIIKDGDDPDYMRPYIGGCDAAHNYMTYSYGGLKGYSFYGSPSWYLYFSSSEYAKAQFRVRWVSTYGARDQYYIDERKFESDIYGTGSRKKVSWGDWDSRPSYYYWPPPWEILSNGYGRNTNMLVYPAVIFLFPGSDDGVDPYSGSIGISAELGESW